MSDLRTASTPESLRAAIDKLYPLVLGSERELTSSIITYSGHQEKSLGPRETRVGFAVTAFKQKLESLGFVKQELPEEMDYKLSRLDLHGTKMVQEINDMPKDFSIYFYLTYWGEAYLRVHYSEFGDREIEAAFKKPENQELLKQSLEAFVAAEAEYVSSGKMAEDAIHITLVKKLGVDDSHFIDSEKGKVFTFKRDLPNAFIGEFITRLINALPKDAKKTDVMALEREMWNGLVIAEENENKPPFEANCQKFNLSSKAAELLAQVNEEHLREVSSARARARSA